MPKKTSEQSSAKNQRARRKLLDLPAKTVRGGDVAAIKDGGKLVFDGASDT